MTLGKFAKDNVFDERLYNEAIVEVKSLKVDIHTAFDSLSLIQGDGVLPAKIIKTIGLG